MKQQISLLSSVLICLFFIIAEVHAAATASVHGSFIETVDQMKEESGPLSANVDIFNVSELSDMYEASATVVGPSLHVRAEAKFATQGFGVVSNAEASWSDRLTIANPHVAWLTATSPVAHFRIRFDGEVDRGEVDIRASVSIADGTTIERRQHTSTDGSTFVNDVFDFEVPVGWLSLFPFNEPGALFQIELGAATSNQILPGEQSTVDFSNTVELMPIYFTDATGNLLPSAPITSESGWTYSVVPEPCTVTMTGWMMLGILSRCRPRK